MPASDDVFITIRSLICLIPSYSSSYMCLNHTVFIKPRVFSLFTKCSFSFSNITRTTPWTIKLVQKRRIVEKGVLSLFLCYVNNFSTFSTKFCLIFPLQELAKCRLLSPQYGYQNQMIITGSGSFEA